MRFKLSVAHGAHPGVMPVFSGFADNSIDSDAQSLAYDCVRGLMDRSSQSLVV